MLTGRSVSLIIACQIAARGSPLGETGFACTYLLSCRLCPLFANTSWLQHRHVEAYGPWWVFIRMYYVHRYTGQNFDAEFIQTMYQVCRHYIGERQSVSLEDMGDYVREKVPGVALPYGSLVRMKIVCLVADIQGIGGWLISVDKHGSKPRADEVTKQNHQAGCVECGVCMHALGTRLSWQLRAPGPLQARSLQLGAGKPQCPREVFPGWGLPGLS